MKKPVMENAEAVCRNVEKPKYLSRKFEKPKQT